MNGVIYQVLLQLCARVSWELTPLSVAHIIWKIFKRAIKGHLIKMQCTEGMDVTLIHKKMCIDPD